MGQKRTATTGLLAPGSCRAGLHVRNIEKMTARQKKSPSNLFYYLQESLSHIEMHGLLLIQLTMH
jgi:hypothetical protein